MATKAFSVEDAIQALEKDGFYSIPDREVGLCLAEMDQGTSQFSPSTVAGLEFYRLHVLQDTVGITQKKSRHRTNVCSASCPLSTPRSNGVPWEITEEYEKTKAISSN